MSVPVDSRSYKGKLLRLRGDVSKEMIFTSFGDYKDLGHFFVLLIES